MYRLYLLRHAQAARAKPGSADFDRSLTSQGRQDADALGKRMRAEGHLPAFVFCSSARRAQETWEAASPHLAHPGMQTIHVPELYRGDAADYRVLIASAPTEDSVLLVGHNSMITELATTLAQGGEPAAMKRLTAGFPTCGLAIFDFADPWWSIAPRTGKLMAFLEPGA